MDGQRSGHRIRWRGELRFLRQRLLLQSHGFRLLHDEGETMTPDECKPGTVVQVHGEIFGIVLGPSAWGINLVDVDTGAYVLPTGTNGLTLAPRFLVGGEWRTDKGDETAQGIIDYVTEPDGLISEGWNWVTFDQFGDAPTYAAARQAVERACGVGGGR
jgi:hypothetical protein